MRVDWSRGIKELKKHRVGGGERPPFLSFEKLDAEDGSTITGTRKAEGHPSKTTVTRTCLPSSRRFAMILVFSLSTDAIGIIFNHCVVISLQRFLKCSKQS